MSKLVSPNELQQAAKNLMLQGNDPVTREDWELCANFWAANLKAGLEEAILPLLGRIFHCPLSRDKLIEIAKFQAKEKGTKQ